jgi:hypothetical protein
MTCNHKPYIYHSDCYECGVRLIMSAYPMKQCARAMTHYVNSYFKADPEKIEKEAREEWRNKNTILNTGVRKP